MLIVKNKRYVKKHVVGGAGIFDTITGFLKRLASSSIAKTVGKELATSAISTAIEKGKQMIIDKTSSPVITQKSKDTLTSLINAGQGIRIQDLVRKMNGGGLRLA